MENPKSTAIFEAGAFAKVIFSTIDVELRGHVDKNVSAAPSFSKPYRVTIAGEGMPVETRVRHVRREVRPQYSTLHLQIRVNAGDVCPGEGRGVDLFRPARAPAERLQNRLKSDPECFQRDDETLFYE
ncbi:unnamed protein product, partial [Symbiodinium microadriaticum]